jgi:hypothetical protein
MADAKEKVHYFHAEAGVLHARLRRPLEQEVKPQAFVKLQTLGGYLSERAENYRLEGIISFKSAYTHVAGHESLKKGRGWTTLATSAIEGLNVFDIVTADRVVGQISTDHPRDGGVPMVTFLGTRFENLKIAGHKVDHQLNLNLCGLKPEGDRLYLEDEAFLKRAGEHHGRVSKAGFSEAVTLHYKVNIPERAELRSQWDKYLKDENPKAKKPTAAVNCSLATDVKAGEWKSGGHVIEVPEFGRIFLADLTVDCNSFSLTMIRLELGCVGDGTVKAGTLVVNGGGKPGGG